MERDAEEKRFKMYLLGKQVWRPGMVPAVQAALFYLWYLWTYCCHIPHVLCALQLKWRIVDNLVPTLLYCARRLMGVAPKLNAEQRRIVASMRREGYAVSSLDALLGPEAARRVLAQDVTTKPEGIAEDAKAAIYCEMMAPPILETVNAYMGMLSRTFHFDVVHTKGDPRFADDARTSEVPPPTSNQLWHRDPEDFNIVRVFCMLKDITPEDGPFQYMPRTHIHSETYRQSLDVQYKVSGVSTGMQPRFDDEDFFRHYDKRMAVTGTGDKGTLIFADTHGYHKQAYGATGDRTQSTTVFVSKVAASTYGRGTNLKPAFAAAARAWWPSGGLALRFALLPFETADAFTRCAAFLAPPFINCMDYARVRQPRRTVLWY